MTITISLLLCLFLFGFTFSSEDALFQSWKATHRKVYSSIVEEAAKLKIFRENLAIIEQLNHENQVINGGKGAVFGTNQFSDLSYSEFKNLYLLGEEVDSLPRSNPVVNTVLKSRARGIPQQVDFTEYLTPVKNQGRCGSCWAFGTTELTESAYLWKNRSIVPLSTQQLVDCSTLDGNGCSGQSTQRTMRYIASTGLVADSEYTYKAVAGECKTDILAKNAHYDLDLTGHESLYRSSEFSDMFKYALKYGPVVIYIAVDEAIQHYRSGILLAKQCPYSSSTSLNHLVQVAGWNVKKDNRTGDYPYWIFRNSWGSLWGEKGFFKVEYGANACQISTGWLLWATVEHPTVSTRP